MAQGPSVYGIDTAPLNIQGINPAVIGQPLQYNPLNFTLPLQLKRMEQERKTNAANIAIREKELAFREKMLEYELAAEERKMYMQDLNAAMGLLSQPATKGTGDGVAGFGEGIATNLTGDLGPFSNSLIAQNMAQDVLAGAEDFIKNFSGSGMDGFNETDFERMKQSRMMGIQNHMKRLSDPNYRNLSILGPAAQNWIKKYNTRSYSTDVPNDVAYEKVFNKILDLNSKEEITLQDVNEMMELLQEPAMLNSKEFESRNQAYQDAFAQTYTDMSLDFSNIDGMLEEKTMTWQRNLDDFTNQTVLEMAMDPTMRTHLLNNRLSKPEEFTELEGELDKLRNDPNYTQDDFDAYLQDEGTLVGMKNFYRSKFAAKQLYDDQNNPYTRTTDFIKDSGFTGGGRGGSSAAGTSQYKMIQDRIGNYEKKYQRIAQGAFDNLPTIAEAEEFINYYINNTEAYEDCQKRKAEAKGDPAFDEDCDAKKPKSRDEWWFDKQEEYLTQNIDATFYQTTSQSIEGKVQNMMSKLDDTIPIGPNGETMKTIMSDVENYMTEYYDENGNLVTLDTPQDVFQYLTENPYLYGAEYMKDGKAMRRVVTLDDVDLKIIATEGVFNPAAVTMDNNGLFSIGLYQLNGKGGSDMIGSFAEQLEFLATNDQNADKVQFVRDAIDNIVEGSNGNYKYKSGVKATDIQNTLAIMTNLDPALMVAHQKAFWEDGWVKPKKSIFDGSISMGGKILVNVNGQDVPVSSNIVGFDYIFKTTATNSGQFGAVMSQYRSLANMFERSKGRVPTAEEAMGLIAMARKNHASNYILETKTLNTYTAKLTSAQLDKIKKGTKSKAYPNGMSEKDIRNNIKAIIEGGGKPGDMLTRDYLLLTRDPNAGGKAWVEAQRQGNSTLQSWLRRVDQDSSDAIAMLKGIHKNEYTLPPEQRQDVNVGNQQGGSTSTQDGQSYDAPVLPQGGSDKINQLNNRLTPSEGGSDETNQLDNRLTVSEGTLPIIRDLVDPENTVEFWYDKINSERSEIADLQKQLEEVVPETEDGFGFSSQEAEAERKRKLRYQIKQKENSIINLDKHLQKIEKRYERILSSINSYMDKIETAPPGKPITIDVDASIINRMVQFSRDGNGKYALKIANNAPMVFNSREELEKALVKQAVKRWRNK